MMVAGAVSIAFFRTLSIIATNFSSAEETVAATTIVIDSIPDVVWVDCANANMSIFGMSPLIDVGCARVRID
jgi:hypothetical protein